MSVNYQLQPGQPVRLSPTGPSLDETAGQILLSTDAVEVTRLVLRAGERRPPHEAYGQTLFYCLTGRAVLRSGGQSHRLEAGEMTWMEREQPHALEAIADCCVIIINLSSTWPRQQMLPEGAEDTKYPAADVVEEASEESFPASDAPGWTQ